MEQRGELLKRGGIFFEREKEREFILWGLII